MRLGLAAAGIAVAAACVTGGATTAAADSEARVAVVLDIGGCQDTATLKLCEGLRGAMRRTGVQARIVSPTFRESLADFIGLIARQHYDADCGSASTTTRRSLPLRAAIRRFRSS